MGQHSVSEMLLASATCSLLLLLLLQAFAKGVGPFLEAVCEHDFIHATKLTLMLAAITVPLNTLFGTVAAILITRNEFPGKVCGSSSSSCTSRLCFSSFLAPAVWLWHLCDGFFRLAVCYDAVSAITQHSVTASDANQDGMVPLTLWLVVLQVLLLSLLDLPFSISPVVTGLMLMLLYGRAGWFATALADSGLKVVFAFSGTAVVNTVKLS
jgi:ABC-type sulfate transport system permease component